MRVLIYRLNGTKVSHALIIIIPTQLFNVTIFVYFLLRLLPHLQNLAELNIHLARRHTRFCRRALNSIYPYARYLRLNQFGFYLLMDF